MIQNIPEILQKYQNGEHITKICNDHNITESKIRLLAHKYNIKRNSTEFLQRKPNKRFNNVEIDILKNIASSHTIDELGLIFNRPYVTIQKRLKALKLKTKLLFNKDNNEKIVLELFNKGYSWKEISEISEIKYSTIYRIKVKYNLIYIKKNKRWNTSEIYKLKRLYKTYSIVDCAKILKRTYESVKSKIRDLREIDKNKFTTKRISKKWTIEQEMLLLDLWLTNTNKQCAKILNRTECSIASKIKQLKKQI